MIAELKSKLVAGRIAAALTLATLLSACGGGGGSSGAAGTPLLGTTPSGTSSAVASLSVAPAPVTLPNDGTATATITVTALDANNVTLKGVPISFAADTGTISPGSTVTDDKGELKATLGIGDNKTKRTITITAAAGGISKTATVSVVESTTAQPVASDASLELSKFRVDSSTSASVDATVTALDAARNTIANLPVKFRVEDGANTAYLESPPSATGANGQARVTVRLGTDRNNRPVVVIAEVGTLSRKATFSVTGAKLNAAPAQFSLQSGQRGSIEYTLLDSVSTPIPNATITVAGPGSATGTGTTNDLGKYTYSYTATGQGPVVVSATAPGDVRAENVIQVDAAVSDVPAGTVIASGTFTATPLVVRVNEPGSTSNRADLRLLFRTSNNQPVPNVRVRLGLGANTSGTDGVISTGNDKFIVADANGIATSSFIAGARSSSTDQVKVYACFGKTDAVEQISACPPANLREVSLTVANEPVSVSVFPSNKVISDGNDYIEEATVRVVDAAGKPKADVQLEAVLDLPTYRKGFWSRSGSTWSKVQTAECANEDSLNNVGFRNNTIETNEDRNGNKQLDPRKSDASLVFAGGISKTDSDGTATLRLRYSQSVGSWAEYSIRVSAAGVVSPAAWAGRVAREGDPIDAFGVPTISGLARLLIVPNDVVKAEAEPPFVRSPYGIVGSCSDPN